MQTTLKVTVSQLNTYIRSRMEEDPALQSLFVVGEISNFRDHYRSGHLYMSLKDEKSVIRAVMFAQYARRLRFRPEDGMKVIARGHVGVYEANGQYQLYIEDMQPDGLGALNLAFEQLKRRLEREGLFAPERKKPLPGYPERVGVITSPTGAAVQDIKTILARRYPLAEIVFCPVLVQGEGAAPQIVQALGEMNRQKAADVIILGRGGGSLEELWAFNEESVARAVAASEIPVISAVGHETDFTICDFAADCRAATPSAAAELAVPDQLALKASLLAVEGRLARRLQSNLERSRQRLDELSGRSVLAWPQRLFEKPADRLKALQESLERAAVTAVSEKRHAFSLKAEKLQALSPLSVLGRGYSIAEKEGTLLKSVKGVFPGDTVRTYLNDGYMDCTVQKRTLKAVKRRKGGAENGGEGNDV